MSAIIGPIAPESNPPIMPQYFVPWAFVITAISLGYPTVVTMTIPPITTLNYTIGQLVRLIIPPANGCRQLNQQVAYVLAVTPPNQVSLDLNSSGGNQFIATSTGQNPQIIAVGDINSGPTNTGRSGNTTFIPGSFINISPI